MLWANSVFEIFTVGVGPSSSHTVGPMMAGALFAHLLDEKGLMEIVHRVSCELFGLLAIATTEPTPGIVNRRRRTASSRTTPRSWRCKTVKVSLSLCRATSNGTMMSVRPGMPSTSSRMRASKPTMRQPRP